MQRTLNTEDLQALRTDFAAKPAYRLAQNAVTRAAVNDVAIDREIVNSIDQSVSVRLDDWKVTNQKKSGRCWLFSGLNLIRASTREQLNLKDFEFSQNWAMFWDKLERANYFLEAMIETAGRDLDDRTVAFLLESVAGDGGQWNMFVAIVRKHGLVPQDAMPETESSSNTGQMNMLLRTLLRQGAQRVREAAVSGGETAARTAKTEVMTVIWRLLCIHLGTPPARLDWQWNDKDREFHRDGELTPLQFAQKYVQLPLDEYVCLVHDPRPTSEVGRTYTVEYLGNVVGAPPVVYLNCEIDTIRQIAASTLADGEPVWFGCDTSPMSNGEYGIWDSALYDYPGVYDTEFTLDKSQRLLLHQSAMTHAMLFTGVDLLDGEPRKWRVENSWGKDSGKDGFYTMNDNWFREYVFEIAARRSALPPALQAAFDREPLVLPAWDPMGALAG